MSQVLIVHAHYLPGYKGGGPIRSLANMIDRLGDEIRFRVLTSDRDFLDTAPYPGIRSDRWHRVGKADVLYLSRKGASLGRLHQTLRTVDFDLLYLNSVLSPVFTVQILLLRRMGLLRPTPLILQPRGELCAGALALKSRKKRAYLAAARALDLYDGILWHASTELEAADIHREFGSGAEVVIAANLADGSRRLHDAPLRSEKKPGALHIAFLSRISRKKNLHGALRLLHGLEGAIEFDLYGPIEDETYWSECRLVIGELPPNVQVHYHGAVRPDQVGAVLSRSQLFFLPTFGENYGHVIREALAAGCPVLLSDQTPWRDLEGKGVGWDLPLDQPEHFRSVLRRCVAMNAATHAAWERRAREYAEEQGEGTGLVDRYRALFARALHARMHAATDRGSWANRKAA